jgi:bifunctional UDP-N-acetylglucosamine pyrophosphorylase/glucosamine-1-phosphate N-acetyltransferase
MRQPRFAAIILAAGSGSRMRSAIPKVMHPVAGRPMIAHILVALEPLRPAASIVVIGTQMGEVGGFVAPMETALQDPPLGTGDAVRIGLEALGDRLAPKGEIDAALVLYGDTPLLRGGSLARLLDEQRRAPAAVLLAGMRPPDPGPYGRLVAGPDGTILRIVEAADAGPEERAIGLVWGGLMLIEARHAQALVAALDRDNAKREF